MRKSVFILFFVLWGKHGYSQYVYYGYPTDTVALRKGDIVILNIPTFSINGDKRFIKVEELDGLIQFLETNDTNTLRIEINYFHVSFLNERVTETLCTNIKEILESKTILKNYYLVSNGSNNPIFDRKEESEKYRFFNTRIEIIVE